MFYEDAPVNFSFSTLPLVAIARLLPAATWAPWILAINYKLNLVIRARGACIWYSGFKMRLSYARIKTLDRCTRSEYSSVEFL